MKKIVNLLLLALIYFLTPGVKAQNFKCPSPGGAFPHPEQCNLYYLCIENKSSLKKCPPKQYFDLVYGGCNWDYLVDCGDRLTPTTEKPPGDFDCPSPGGAFPHPEKCEFYYVCIENKATLHQCPLTQLFDLKYSGCNWDYLVDCGDRTRPEIPTTESPPGEFRCPTPGGAFPHPEKCEFYYLCLSNKPHLKECPVRQLFDLVYSGCNWENYVDCGKRIRPPRSTFPPSTTSEPPADFDCPTAHGLFPNPKDCSTFFQCNNFKPTLQTCPPKLLFHDIELVCDFHHNVNCGDRPIPSNPEKN